MKLVSKILSFLWDILESTTFALALFTAISIFFFQPGQVYGASSYPTWKDGEKFITDKISYHFQKPKRFDFIVIKSPKNPDVDLIKRLVGLPGETIRTSNCQVYINGHPIDESAYLEPATCTGPESFLPSDKTITIPAGSYFVLGDNRPHSSDSRDFGPIPETSVIGKATLRFWPPDRFGFPSN